MVPRFRPSLFTFVPVPRLFLHQLPSFLCIYSDIAHSNLCSGAHTATLASSSATVSSASAAAGSPGSGQLQVLMEATRSREDAERQRLYRKRVRDSAAAGDEHAKQLLAMDAARKRKSRLAKKGKMHEGGGGTSSGGLRYLAEEAKNASRQGLPAPASTTGTAASISSSTSVSSVTPHHFIPMHLPGPGSVPPYVLMPGPPGSFYPGFIPIYYSACAVPPYPLEAPSKEQSSYPSSSTSASSLPSPSSPASTAPIEVKGRQEQAESSSSSL